MMIASHRLTIATLLLMLLLMLLALLPLAAIAQAPRFYNLVTGDPLDFTNLKESETPAVKSFKQTGHNPYNKDAAAIKSGESLYATACSGCHGHHAEGKLGPGLADDYWTYPANATDAGMFSAIFDGLQGQMGPQRGLITQDQMLQIMAWLRSIYKGSPAKAE